jgi:hypothetical protein
MIESLETRLALSSYNILLNSKFEAGTAIVGQVRLFNQLGTFQGSHGSKPVTSSAGFSAIISWGDGSLSHGNIHLFPGTSVLFQIDGAHAYSDPGSGRFNIQIQLTDPDGGIWTGRPTIVTVDAASGPIQTPVLVGSEEFNVAFGQVADSVIQSSEYDQLIVQQAYEHLLDRDPDPGGNAWWAALLQNGQSEQTLDASIASSDEFFHNAGSSNDDWIRTLYTDFLYRDPSSKEIKTWDGLLSNGMSKNQAASVIAGSPERFRLEISKDYIQYLDRTPSPVELSGWQDALQNGVPLQELPARFQASAENFNKTPGGPNVDGWLRATYDNLLRRPPDPAGLAYFKQMLSQLDGQWSQSPVYLCDSQGDLLTVDLYTGKTHWVGNTGVVLTDIAMNPHGQLFGVDSVGGLYQIDPASGALLSQVALQTNQGTRATGINALEFRADGQLFAAGGSHVYEVDADTGRSTEIGASVLGPHQSAGGLAFDANGNLYVTSGDGLLLEVDPASNGATAALKGLPTDLFGLVLGPADTFYAFSNSGQSIVNINLNSDASAVGFASGARLSSSDGPLSGVYGATVSPAVEALWQAGVNTPGRSSIPLTASLPGSNVTVTNAQEWAQLVWTTYTRTNGPIAIATVTNKPGTYVVLVAGTQTSDPFSLFNTVGYDASAVAGKPDKYLYAIIEAMEQRYRIPKGAQIILVGHSLGGMELENLVALQYKLKDPLLASYHFRSLITFGSPLTAFGNTPNTVAFTTDTDWISGAFHPANAVVFSDSLIGGQGGDLALNILHAGGHIDYPEIEDPLQDYDAAGNLFSSPRQGTSLDLADLRYFQAPGIFSH